MLSGELVFDMLSGQVTCLVMYRCVEFTIRFIIMINYVYKESFFRSTGSHRERELSGVIKRGISLWMLSGDDVTTIAID